MRQKTEFTRIYQGRVSRVEFPNPVPRAEPAWLPAPDGDDCLWAHHQLFQDAVNYYLVALLALAAPTNRALGRLRERIDLAGDPFEIWAQVHRRGSKRRGLRDSVASYLTPANGQPSAAEAFAAVLAGNETDVAVRDAAVTALLEACDGPSSIRNEGRAYLPRFCVSDTGANFVGDAVMVRREHHQKLLPHILHDPVTQADSPSLDVFDAHSIATPDIKRPLLSGADARDRLQQAVDYWRERRPAAGADFDRLASLVAALPADTTLQGYVASAAKEAGGARARLFALLLFRHVERSEFTLDLLRSATPAPRPGEAPPVAPEPSADSSSGDPIRAARGARGYVFRAFTSLPCWNPADTPEPQWKEFDIAAFKYALTALNQIEEKTKERAAEAAVVRHRLDYMQGRAVKFTPPKGAGESDEAPSRLAGDPRITLLRAVIESEALRVNNAMTDGDAIAPSLSPRTVRGFRDLRKRWRRHVAPGESHSPEKERLLRDELHVFQAENSETIGHVTLFDQLILCDHWPIWQEPTPETAAAWADAGFADDPLEALVEEHDLAEQLERLAEPVKLTPADPEHSRRQYDFHAVSKFSAGPRAKCRHEPGACAFTTEIARQEAGIWRPVRVRIRYTAPRLLRDGLRAEDGAGDLATAGWLQPMMEALVPAPALPQDLTDCPVCLMPDFRHSGERRVLLNFPVTLDPAALVTQLGRTSAWDGQFCGPRETPFALRWPADGWPAGKEAGAWYHRGELTRFTVLGVDLGTRDAGALAHVTVAAGTPVKPVHRFLGEAGGRRWLASLTGTQLVRLPGEDAKVFVPGRAEPVMEPYGEPGRGASPQETEEAVALCRELGEEPAKLFVPTADVFSFPQQNDKLLVALRRAQGRLRDLQSLSWRLRNDAERAAAIEQARTAFPQLAGLPAEQAIAAIDERLRDQRALVSRSLVTVANRILPLRGRRWVWVRRDDDSGAHVLRQTDPDRDLPRPQIAGQRGLSHERMEQIEELRRRCQSLSRALMHAPGERPEAGRRTRGRELPDPCPALLEKIEHLRDQRVDQTAHAILAAALGVRLRAPSKDAATRRARDIHGEYERFRDPVDFIVIEDLSRYLSSQDRARRENTRLMQWCHRQLVTKLRQLCETYGLPVLATPAAYSSRFCSRTGAAGFRAVELTPAHREKAPWRFALERLRAHDAGEKSLDGPALAEARRVHELFAELDRLNLGRKAAGKPPRTLLAPQPGGPIFVPASEGPAMQADLNAATNIALRALAAPDRHDIHHRLRTERAAGVLRLRRSTQREKARWPDGAPALSLPPDAVAAERTPNVFADVARVADFDQVTLNGIPGGFATSRGLWRSVKQEAWKCCAALNDARHDDISM